MLMNRTEQDRNLVMRAGTGQGLETDDPTAIFLLNPPVVSFSQMHGTDIEKIVAPLGCESRQG